jgi:hypothetical protein
VTEDETRRYDEALRQKDEEAYAYLLADARGRWHLARLGSVNFLYTGTFTGDNRTFWNEGRRALVVELYDRIRCAGEWCRRMLQRAEEERLIFTEKALEKSKKGEAG